MQAVRQLSISFHYRFHIMRGEKLSPQRCQQAHWMGHLCILGVIRKMSQGAGGFLPLHCNKFLVGLTYKPKLKSCLKYISKLNFEKDFISTMEGKLNKSLTVLNLILGSWNDSLCYIMRYIELTFSCWGMSLSLTGSGYLHLHQQHHVFFVLVQSAVQQYLLQVTSFVSLACFIESS